MDEFSKLEETRRHCYSLCSSQRSKVALPWTEHSFFQSVLERFHCIRRCTEEETKLQSRGAVALKLYRRLAYREPLYYLQVALFKVSQLHIHTSEHTIRNYSWIVLSIYTIPDIIPMPSNVK